MIEGLLLQQRLDAVRDALRMLKRRRAVVVPLVCGAVAAMCLVGFGQKDGWLWSVLLLAIVGLWILMARWAAGQRLPNDLDLARLVESEDPALDARLVTAVEILEKPREPGASLAFLEQRVIADALRFQDGEAWVEYVTGEPMRRARRWAGVALGLFLITWFWLTLENGVGWLRSMTGTEVAIEEVTTDPRADDAAVALSFVVTPGQVELELGSRLIVEAKPAPQVPAEASLVWHNKEGQELGRASMVLGVDDETFGAMVPRVQEDLTYRVEAGGSRSEDFDVTTFVYPKLERLDVTIIPPAYTGLPQREVKNTRKVSAPELSELKFRVKINKPVVDAELFGEDEQVITLTPTADDATLLEGRMVLEKSQKYRLHLVDAQDRANVKPPWITLTALPNALAKIEVVFPKRDLQVSSLQELPVEARVWDDVGVVRSGATVSLAGGTREFVFDHPQTAPNQKQSVSELLNLESEGVSPRQLVSYFFWAEDAGPKGEVRRAMSDMFFAQVRHFEDIFRETEAPPPSPGMPGEQQAGKLVELQKQVVNATWKIVRNVSGGQSMEKAEADVAVVRESQGLVLEQTKEQMEETDDPEIKNALTEAWKEMREALEALEIAQTGKQRAALNQSLEHEQSALQWLYQASEREHLVAKQNPKSPSQGGGSKEQQEQLMNLELKQEEQRYEEEKVAEAEQTAQQQENLEVLNRLKELARRQEALAKKMQELREQLADAKTEDERQELTDQLQRLQEEQQELLAGLDDLQDKLEQSERNADLAETREQLEQVREKAMEAADELGEQNLAEAANAATRAQRELEQIQEDFREKTARRFSEEMKGMKQQAQEVAKAQEQISEALENQKTPEGAERGDTSNSLERMLSGSEVARAIADQQERVKDLMESMQQVSEQAEGSEPILSRRLYEAVRGAQTSGLEDQLEEARRQSRYGDRSEAQEAERKATTAVEQLAKNIDRAAEAVLGSETEALRMARSELDRLIEEAESDSQKVADANQAQDSSKQTQDAEGGKPSEGRAPSAQDPKLAGTDPSGAEGEQGKGRESDPAAPGAQGKSASNEATEGEPGEGKDKAKMTAGDGKGEGEPGEGAGKGQQASAQEKPKAASEGEGEGEGQGKPAGEMAGKGQGRGGEGESPGEAAGKGNPSGEGQPSGQGQVANAGGTQGQPAGSSQAQSEPSRGGDRQLGTAGAGSQTAQGGAANGGGAGWFFDETAEEVSQGPFSGEGYRDWSERLATVEELLNDPELANEAARVADNARAMRLDSRRNNSPPVAAELQNRITMPLLELRDRVSEELARKSAGDSTVPIDRDPVPPTFRELVRKYYSELGGGQ